jgi:hypothetical protein
MQRVAVYVFIPGVGWWTKPYYTERCTQIRSDGTWSVLATTGGVDHLATLFAAFLIPGAACYDNQIIADGDSCLPEAVYQAALDYDVKRREDPNQRRISFSGYEWLVKSSAGTTIGPGPNYFSDDTSNVWVDQLGRLHLRITYRNGKWNCAEVIAGRSLGYGTHRFYLDSRVDDLDPGVVLGLFTYSDECPPHLDGCISAHREMDVEFTRWGDPNNPQNAQFVVQEWDCTGHLERFTLPPALTQSTQQFRWMPESVWFQSSVGHSLTPPPAGILHQWTFSKPGEVPVPGLEQCRMNLYLVNGMPPTNGLEREVIIRRFEYIPCRPPMDVSLTPASGMFAVGTKYTFACKYSDPDGYSDVGNCYLLINTTLNQANALFVRYDANANLLWLKSDDNTTWLGGYPPGSANIIENNQGKVYCADTTVPASGMTRTVNWMIEFKPGLSPKICKAWTLVYDDSYLRDGWDYVGDDIRVSRKPVNISLSPTNGTLATGVQHKFTSVYADADGRINLANCYLLMNTSLNQANAVFVRYDSKTNLLWLKSDDNTTWLGGHPPGSANVIENTQGELYSEFTNITRVGTRIIVDWKLEFKAAMSGKTCGAWMLVFDDLGFRDGYDRTGTLTVQ